MKSPILVLTTVNAPYSKKLDARGSSIVCWIPLRRRRPAVMSSFFGDVEPELQIAFAEMYGINHDQLVAAAKTFAEFSGQSYPLAA